MKNDFQHPQSEELFAFRDGELLPEKRAIIEAHVMGCSVCRSFIDQVSSLEAELRQSPDRAPTGYLESLHEKVRARIAVAASEAAGEEAPVVGVPEGGERRRGGVRLRERRRDDAGARRERGRVKEAPVLPWAAVLSTVSAAAAVLVVVAILIKQGPYQRMITPKVPTVASPSAGGEGKREGDARGEGGVTLGTVSDKAAGGAPGKKVAAGAPGKDAGVAAREKPAEETTRGAAPPMAKLDQAPEDRLGKAADQAAQKAEPAPEQLGSVNQGESSESRERLQQEPQASAAPRSFARMSQALAPGYAAILSRFGLPPIWNAASVSPEALANAEPELRSLYVSGAAGSDSARVRLYLAEAVRQRYAPGDSTLYDEIQRHYHRAIDLAGTDVETARVAEERLRTLGK